MGAGRHRKPSFADSLAPKGERKPRVAPESDRDDSPVWLLQRIDFDGPWCWKRMDLETLHRVHERLSAFERMTFKEIEGRRNHQIPVERLGKAAQNRLVELGIDESRDEGRARLGPQGAERDLSPLVGPDAQRLSDEHRRQLSSGRT